MDLALDWSDLALLLHGGKRLEADLHTRFKPYRLGRSEWFAVEGELAEFIASFGAGDSSGTGARSGLGASSGSTDKKELAPVSSGAKTAPGDKNLPVANSVAGDSTLTSDFVSGASSRPEIADALAPARMEELLAESRLEIDPVFLPGASVPGAKKSVPGPGANSGAGDSKAVEAGARLATEAPVSEKLATEGEPRPGANSGAGDSSEVPGASGKRRKRRPMDEWVELATPIFHAEFTRRRRQPTGEEFAEALELAGYGAVSASTAKNIRTQILDTTELPALV
jgi:hypothetical protein